MASCPTGRRRRSWQDGRWAHAYPGQKDAAVPADLAAALAADPLAKKFFETLTGANRYAILYRIHDAKRPQTRAAHIAMFVQMRHNGETIH